MQQPTESHYPEAMLITADQRRHSPYDTTYWSLSALITP